MSSPANSVRQKTVWITGASSGIGAALARKFASEKFCVILSARSEENLKVVAEACRNLGGTSYVLPLDLTNITSFPEKLETLRSEIGRLDILINNGGLSQRSLAVETNLDVDRQIFETNYFGTISLTKLVARWMLEEQQGQIVAISSISGLFGFPLRSSYSASKHAMVGYFETLGLELVNQGISTTLVFPGRIQTDISLNAITKDGSVNGTMNPGLANGMKVEVCANKVFAGIMKKKRRILVGKKELLMVYIHKYLPKLFWYLVPRIKHE
ncbi:MAG: dehydrogenase/reductase SDR family protein 7B [Bacteroidia bacterium]|jgi:dehydrogenase/reductase SDR family protein 7B